MFLFYFCFDLILEVNKSVEVLNFLRPSVPILYPPWLFGNIVLINSNPILWILLKMQFSTFIFSQAINIWLSNCIIRFATPLSNDWVKPLTVLEKLIICYVLLYAVEESRLWVGTWNLLDIEGNGLMLACFKYGFQLFLSRLGADYACYSAILVLIEFILIQLNVQNVFSRQFLWIFS